MGSQLGLNRSCSLKQKNAARRLHQKVPWAILLTVSAASLLLWQILRAHQVENIRLQVQQEKVNLSYAIEQEMKGAIFALERMTNRWEQSGKPERSRWESDAALYVKHYGTFQAIAWADPDFRIQWVVPLLGNEASQGFNLLSESHRRATIEKAIAQHQTAVTPTIPLIQGGQGFLVYMPVFHQKRFAGVIIGAFRIRALLDKVVKGLEQQGSGEYAVQLYDGPHQIYYYRQPAPKLHPSWSQVGQLNGGGVFWHLKVAPSQQLLAATYSPIAEFVLGVGLVLGLLLAIIAHLGLITYEQNQKTAAEIARSLAAEKQLNAFKSQFITSASHEFRTPLAIISSSTGILEDYYDRLETAKRQKHLQRIQHSVRHLEQILEDVLMIEQIEKGKLKFTPSQVDLEQVYRSIIKEVEQDIAQSLIVVTLSTHPGTDGFPSQSSVASFIALDEQLVRQILINLLSNAVKYSSAENPVFLNICYQPQTLVFEIKDQGIGIPEEDLKQIFTPFYRGSNVGKIPGTGLGLTLVNQCVKLHGGTIAVNSRPGSGTCVAVCIPIY